jgi:hypothetical protein
MSLACAAPISRGSSQLEPSSVLVSPWTIPAHAAAVGRAVDRGDDRLRDGAHGRDELRVNADRPRTDPRDGQAVDVRDQGVVLEVEAGAERASRAGEHDDPAVVVPPGALEHVLERQTQVDGHGVAALGPIEADDPDVGPRLLEEYQGHCRPPWFPDI